MCDFARNQTRSIGARWWTPFGLVVAGLASGQSFIERAEFGTGATIPIAWCDVDGDGDLDLAVGNWGGPNQWYVNQGDGSFEGRSDFGGGFTFAVVWVDIDEDGDADLAVGNGSNGQNYLYLNRGDATFEVRNEFGLDRTNAFAWGDADGDGDLDLAVGNGITGVAQQNRLYRNNGDGTFAVEDQFGVEQTDSLVWGDYDNDGDLDLAVGNGGFSAPAQNYLYVNNGDGTFIPQEQFGLGDTAVVAWADADNDGDLDLAVGNWNAGQNYLYINNGDGSFEERSEFGARDTNTVAWGDFDNDGDLDLAVGNGDFTSAEQNYLYINRGDGRFDEVEAFGVGSTDSVAWADVDLDGDLDLAAGNEHSPPQNYLYVNEGSVGHWLAVDLAGVRHARGDGFSNRDAVGARVSAFVAGHAGDPEFRLGWREVSAHGGFASQNGHDAWFGLGEETAVDLVVSWPGSANVSITQTFTSISADQAVRLVEFRPFLHAPEPGVAGVRNRLRVSGARAGARIHFAWSLASGDAAVPGCPDLTVQLRAPRVAGAVNADNAGEASLIVGVPSGASGRTVFLQAVDQEACVTSNRVVHAFP